MGSSILAQRGGHVESAAGFSLGRSVAQISRKMLHLHAANAAAKMAWSAADILLSKTTGGYLALPTERARRARIAIGREERMSRPRFVNGYRPKDEEAVGN